MYQLQRDQGAYIAVFAPDTLQAGRISQIDALEEFASSSPVVDSFTWQTFALNSLVPQLNSLEIMNVGQTYSDSQHLYAISPNYFDVSLSNYLIIDLANPDPNNLWPSQQLYTADGSKSICLASYYETSSLGLNLTQHVIVEVTRNTVPLPSLQRSRLRPLSFFSGAPGFTMSPFDHSKGQDALVSLPSFLRITNGLYSSVDELPMQAFLVKMTSSATDSDVETVVTSLNDIVKNTPLTVWDYNSSVQPINTANNILFYFFNGTTVLAMLISFFSLMASMYSNIFEQTKELAVIRAIGVRRFSVFRIYLWEAFVVVIAASLTGVIIGTFIGWTMTIQRVLFTQLPITLTFPWQLLLVILGVAVVVSILATASPTWRITRQPIVKIMRFVS